MVDKDTKYGTRRQLIKMAGVAGAGVAGMGTASAHGGEEKERPKVKCRGKKIVVKHIHKKLRKGSVAFCYKTKGGEKKWTGISLKWVKPGDRRTKNGIKIKRTDDKVIATTNANWTPYKAQGEVYDEKFSHKCKHDGDKPKRPKCDIKFYKNCRRVTVKCDKKVKVKAYTKHEHKWGGKVIEKETDDFDWTLQKKGNYFTKVKVYYKGKKVAEKHCDRKHKPKCDIKFHKNCKRVRVECDKKVKVKAYTKKEHKWGGKVIEKEGVKEFDWTLQKRGNYFTEVKVYFKGEKVAYKKCDREKPEKPDFERPEVKCYKGGKKAIVKPISKKAKKGEVAVGVRNRKGKKVWSGFSLKWNEPGDSKHKKHVTYTRKDDKVVIKADEGWRIFYVNGSVHGKKFSKKCDYEFDKPDHGKPKCKFYGDKKVVIKNVPKKARKGSVAASIRNKWGKTKWSGISLKWVTPGDVKEKNGIRYKRTDSKVVVTSRKSGWKINRVKGSVMGKKFDCKKDDHDRDHDCRCDRHHRKKVVIKNVPKHCRKGKVAACIRKDGKTRWSGIGLKWVKAGDTKWKKGMKYTRKDDKIVVECYKSGWDLHRVKGKIKGQKFDTNDH